jgi:predicted nucleic acid-binding protein
MTRFAIDADVALRLAEAHVRPGPEHQLVAPATLRSDVLDLTYRRERAGDLREEDALAMLDHVTSMKMRLLNDRVSRRVAWGIARDLDLADTRLAAYVAVARLQADVLVTDDPELRRVAQEYMATADPQELMAALV